MKYLNCFKVEIVFSKLVCLFCIYTIWVDKFWFVDMSSLFLSLYLLTSFLLSGERSLWF
jgi:hypothetical protein